MYDDFEPVAGRIFVAISPPDYATRSVAEIQKKDDPRKQLKWIPPEKRHLTLAFFGEMEAQKQRELVRLLKKIRVRRFYLELQGLGVFPGKGRPQVLWAGLAPADPLLFQLHGKIEQIVLDLGFEPDLRRFSPHVTLARCGDRSSGVIQRILKKNANFGSAPFEVQEVILYASQFHPGGSVYNELLRVPFD